MLSLTESGSLCCSRKAENSTSLSLDVPMERPCHAGAVGAGAAVGSKPAETPEQQNIHLFCWLLSQQSMCMFFLKH